MSEQALLRKPPAFRWYMLLMNVLAYGQFFLTAQVPVAFRAYIIEDLSISATQASLFYTIILGVFAFTGTFGAKVATKVGMKKCVCLGILINIVGALLILVLGGSFFGYAICCAIEGLCGGMMCSTMVALTSFWFPVRERGLASGILLGILGVGFSIATFFAPRMIAMGMTWQMGACLLTAVPAAVILLIYFFTAKTVEEIYPGYVAIADLLPEETSSNSVKLDVETFAKTMPELYRRKEFWMAGIAAFANGCMSYGFPAFVNGLLVTDKGLDATMANLVTSVTFFVTIFGSPLGGIISDRVFKGSRWQTVALCFALVDVMLLLVAFSNGIVLVIAMILAYMVASMITGPYWAIPAVLGHPDIANECSGIINVFGNIGGFVIGFLLTALASMAGNYFICLYTTVAIAAIGAISITFVRR